MGSGFRLSPRYGPLVFLALRGSLAVALSWQIAAWVFGSQAATLAPISALLVIQPTGWQTVRRAGERMAGVVLGVSIAAVAAHFFGVSFALLALVVAAGYAVGFAVQKRGAYLATQVPVSATLGLLVGSQSGAYPVERIVGSLIGGVIGTVLSLLLTPPFYVEQARVSVADAARALAGGVPDLARAFRLPTEPDARQQLYAEMRRLEEQVDSAEQALLLGVESTRLNVWARRAANQLDDYPLVVLNLQRIARQLRRIAYTVQEQPARDAATFPWAGRYADLLGGVQNVLLGLSDQMGRNASPPGPDSLQTDIDRLRHTLHDWERDIEESAASSPGSPSDFALRGALLLDMQRMIAELDAASSVIHSGSERAGVS